MFRYAAAASFVLLASGCATAPAALREVASVELTDVPFFPQTEFQCGPAALATILADNGVPVVPDDLISDVYIEGLQGSLQAELLSATRRRGLIPYPVEQGATGLFAEIDAGRPVLVMQNLRLKIAPAWHYAVVVGFERERNRVVLRSGTNRRRLERGSRFLRSWRLADHWAFVALRPGELPAAGDAETYIRALLGAQSFLGEIETEQAYRNALARWPENEMLLFVSATRLLDRGEWLLAESAYRRILAGNPRHAAARNNLANALMYRGCYTEAASQAHTALSFTENARLVEAIEDTMRSIEAAPAPDGTFECVP